LNFAAWKCVDRTDITRSLDPVRSAQMNATQPANVVSGIFTRCDVQAASDMTGLWLYGSNTGTIYGFVHQPARAISLAGPAVDTFWADNLIWIVLGFCGFGAILAAIVYASKRLHRYRKKYHEESKQVEKMQEEVDNMEQFGGQAGTKDETLEMMSNPMVVQMQQMQARLDRKNAEVMAEERKERQDASEVRQEHISALQTDADKLREELEELKKQLALSQPSGRPAVAVAVAVPSSGGAHPHRAPPPARSESTRQQFDSGRPGPRKKKEID